MTEQPDSSGRVASGNPRLDAILGGGFPAHGINLVVGPPGSGKTVLAQQYVFHNATPDRPAAYLTTVSEPLEKVLRYGQTMAFFDASAVGRAVFYEDVGGLLGTEGLAAVLERVDTLLKERRPAIMVVDSFKALTPYATDQGGFRRFLHSLAGQLSAFPVTSLWIGEYDSSELSTAPEFAVADAIISLSSDRVGQRELRVLEVLKLRGSGFLSGRHAYRLSEAGMDVFPRLADPIDATAYPLGTERVSSGIPALDADARRRVLARSGHAGRRPHRIREDPHGPAFHRQRRPSWRARRHRHPAGEPNPATKHRPGIWLVAHRRRDRAAVPLAGRPVHRPMGV
jgi:circadian clock protein KaiC